MEKMKELFEKVAADSKLQEKFLEATKGAESVGANVIVDNLTVFAKEAGFDVSPIEIREFFKNLPEKQQSGELSDAELDVVAGGKNTTSTLTSVFAVGLGCSDDWEWIKVTL